MRCMHCSCISAHLQVQAATYETLWQSSSPANSVRQPALRNRRAWQLRSSNRLLLSHTCDVPEQAVRACCGAFQALHLIFKQATFMACGTPHAGAISCPVHAALVLSWQCGPISSAAHAGQEGLPRQHHDVSAAAVAGLLKTAVLEDSSLQWHIATASPEAARQPVHSALAALAPGQNALHGVDHTPRCSAAIPLPDCCSHNMHLSW